MRATLLTWVCTAFNCDMFTASVGITPAATLVIWRSLPAVPTDTVLARVATELAPRATELSATALAPAPRATALLPEASELAPMAVVGSAVAWAW
ncbi:hypothetical protein LMG19083_04865 [Ralstonia psammae]|uniref:Secreted protein n=1 Tax=Ralstonia psammae TaxID=3058598 RepID=A0ABN9JHE5_9RALS|nr:hypothetical protein LMG19083_04865 [Ralstonia sp. LMG 19083]